MSAPRRARKRRVAEPDDHEQQRVTELEREIGELPRTNEILKLASTYFARSKLDRQLKT